MKLIIISLNFLFYLTMIINLFSVFDPSTSQNLSLNWFRMSLIFTYLPYKFWFRHSRYTILWSLIIKYLFNEFKVLISYSFSNLIIFISLIIFIFFSNFLGLFPYIFTATRHIRICLSFSLSLWLGLMIFRILNYFNDLISHLTPQGTPSVLIPFIVIIESIRLIIRPITLAVRLTANIIAGHILLALLGRTGENLSIILLVILLGSQILLYILELAVSLIQAYVFSILSTLYRREIYD